MTREEIELVERIKAIGNNLKCPHCNHGIQIEDRNCQAGYTPYTCCSCGYVEQSDDRLNRAIMKEASSSNIAQIETYAEHIHKNHKSNLKVEPLIDEVKEA